MSVFIHVACHYIMECLSRDNYTLFNIVFDSLIAILLRFLMNLDLDAFSDESATNLVYVQG